MNAQAKKPITHRPHGIGEKQVIKSQCGLCVIRHSCGLTLLSCKGVSA